MNQITELAETIGAKQVEDFQQTTEKFEIVKVRNDNNKFNMTVTNTGDIPVHLTRFWIENTTDSSWPVSKFDLDIAIGPGDSIKNIGQNLDLTALDTQSYYAQLVSERGNQQQMFLNSVGDSSLFLRLTATPAVMPTTFSTTVTLEVINTGTQQLLNLQPTMKLVSTPVCNSCVFVEEQSAVPSSFDSLNPGDVALFEWIYSFTGENGDQIQFEAGLLNDVETDTVTVTLQTIESSLNADVAIESGGLGDQTLLGPDVLIFHKELTVVDSGNAYQMYSGSADGGGNGDRISLDAETPHFVTNNGTLPNRVPAGDWDLALMLSSEPVGKNIDTAYDMIFHFEDGDDVDPDNSEGSSSRDLTECGITSYSQEITNGFNDADEKVSNGDVRNDDADLDLAYDNGGGQEFISAVRFTGLNVDKDTTINSAYIVFQPDETDGGTVNLRIYGHAIDDAPDFEPDSNYLLSGLPKTTAFVDWNNVPSWTTSTINSGTITPDLSPIIQELVNRPGWVNGNDVALIFYDNGSVGGAQRAAEAEDSNDNPAPTLTVTWGSGSIPDWQDNTGPHNSGSYFFDGVDDCFRSLNPVSGSDGNNIADKLTTTAFWFKTQDNDLAIAEDMYIVDWTDGTGCPNCEHYRVLLTAGAAGPAGGKIQFHYSPNNNNDNVICTSVNDYDDAVWHHVIVSKDGDKDDCKLTIMNLDGDNPEAAIYVDDNVLEQNVEVDGSYWHVGSNVDMDGNFFKGWIDDIMHWDDDFLSDSDRDDLGRTNYGDRAHEFDLTLDILDGDGVFVSNMYTSATPVQTEFADPKEGGNNDDWAYVQTNMTMNLPEVNLLANQRLDLSFAWKSPTATWEALEVDMKIDDTSMTSPYPSFMQIPYPDNPFPTYFEHSPQDEFKIYVSNTGEDGIFLTYQGTRVNFNGTNGSYAGLVKSGNGTNINEDHDSMHVPPGEVIQLLFHEATNIPSIDESGTLMIDGIYYTTVWINGYSDQGETFSRSVVVGSVDVVTP